MVPGRFEFVFGSGIVAGFETVSSGAVPCFEFAAVHIGGIVAGFELVRGGIVDLELSCSSI